MVPKLKLGFEGSMLIDTISGTGDWKIRVWIFYWSALRIWGCGYRKGEIRPRKVRAVKDARLGEELTNTTVF
jgi:hypothetical protein